MKERTLEIRLSDQSYPIHIGSQLFSRLPTLLLQQGITEDRRLMVITDNQVGKLHASTVVETLREAGYVVHLAEITAGEHSKNLLELERLIGACIVAGLDRRSVILALGGGVVGDLAGFVAASYMRGISFVQLPTTLLAHDSSVGGKVGVNHPQAKNYIGAFHQPELVVFDVDSLRTLPEREVRNGFTEVIKHGLIWDVHFVSWLETHVDSLLQLEPTHLIEAIYRGCQVKAAVVSQDEREQGIRAILNYGHTIGHALEAVSHYQHYKHGEAVAIGIAGAVRLSQKYFSLPMEIVERTEALLNSFGLPTRIDENWSMDELVQAMRRDKKARNGKLNFVLTTGLGKVELVHEISTSDVEDVLTQIWG
ncbi:3-dehydroquinate synthase [Seinonella peptonophila]|uniref:3-dehydroquinate synthase n=1 Tax=Seinonella peptonophila TaxID=112248 RepID=A0A1M4TFC5_9BACL|nr:3-dehydroquinate synthase [Seinonella peptonophila]SHE43163.1 3-dehydroquinate synthase [Seinonella peptonophila]